MSISAANIDLVIQYALLVAGQEDEYFERQLGPIHLIKYVYLADLAYAKRNNGQTFTGADWRFYKFGPWTQVVNERIEPALASIHADKIVLESNYEDRDEWVRWSLQDERLLQEKEGQLPTYITYNLRNCIHKFKADTPDLLHFVYKTKPMLNAAPNEHLDFIWEAREESLERQSPSPSMLDSLSKKKRKRLNEGMRQIRERQQTKGARTARLVKPDSEPKYDEVYAAGIAWLDSLAGPEISADSKTIEFSDEIWKSPARQDKDVS